MIGRVLLVLLLAAASLPAQLLLFTVEGDAERLVGNQLDVGTAVVGDYKDTLLRVRNVGSAPLDIITLYISGTGFRLIDPPKIPYTLYAGGRVDFALRFEPSGSGYYSAVLNLNNASPIVRGTGVASATIYTEEGGALKILDSRTPLDFGNVERGQREERKILLVNRNNQRITVASVTLSGDAFAFVDPVPTPISLAPGASFPFRIAFSPQAIGKFEGSLGVDIQQVAVRGAGIEPSFPQPEIVLPPQALSSAQQAQLVVRFSEPSRTTGNGRIRIEFRPSTSVEGDDPGVLFPATGSRSASFSVSEGDRMARFGSQVELDFQTGTTAGDIIFTAELGDSTDRKSITIAPQIMVVDTARGVRTGSNLEVQIAGFDNTRSASRVSFTFLDRSGQAVPPGAIPSDVASAFRQYFQSSGVGGVFSLRAVFPVTGDASQIDSVDIELTNSAGTAKPPRVKFP